MALGLELLKLTRNTKSESQLFRMLKHFLFLRNTNTLKILLQPYI